MLTTAQAARIARKPRTTILQWIVRGHLKATKLGRDYVINEKDLTACLNAPRKAGRPKKENPK